jgi:hypothetical protein
MTIRGANADLQVAVSRGRKPDRRGLAHRRAIGSPVETSYNAAGEQRSRR